MNNNKVSLTKTVLFTVCSILVLDSFVAPTIIGVSSITIWIISAIFFFLPYGLMSAELGSTYPDDGGIVSWVQRAFGEFWGVMVLDTMKSPLEPSRIMTSFCRIAF